MWRPRGTGPRPPAPGRPLPVRRHGERTAAPVVVRAVPPDHRLTRPRRSAAARGPVVAEGRVALVERTGKYNSKRDSREDELNALKARKTRKPSSSAPMPAESVTRRRILSGKAASTLMPPKRSPSSIRRGNSIPNASPATPRAGTASISSRSWAASIVSPLLRTWPAIVAKTATVPAASMWRPSWAKST